MINQARLCVALFAAFWLAMMSSGCSTHGDRLASTGPGASIPAIAKLGRVTIGYSTQEDLARRWGEGKIITGGHPNSGRVWRIEGTDWILKTDGFDYSDRGLVVDDLVLSIGVETSGLEPQVAVDLPPARLSSEDFAWLGGIRLGMSRGAVEDYLKRKSVTATASNQDLIVRANGDHKLVNSTLGLWLVHLSFTTNGLSKLSIQACERLTR